MGRTSRAAFLIFWAGVVWTPAARAASQLGASAMEVFPSSREYYYPLLADPTELNYSARYYWQVHGGRLAEVSFGDYLGLARWKLPQDFDLQLNIGGGLMARFDMGTVRNALQVADYTATVPIDLHKGAGTLRTELRHTSSHLGDDFIADNNVTPKKRANDLIKTTYSYTPSDELRIYVGNSHALNVVNIVGSNIWQGGLELTGPYTGDHRAQYFLAQDVQSFQRVKWNPSYTMRLGIRVTNNKHIGAAKLFVEYFSGHLYYLQLFERKETRWGIGLAFEIGNPAK